MAPRWIASAVVVVVLTAFAALTILGVLSWEGPVLVGLSHDHGVHVRDLLVVGGWAVAVVALAALNRSR